MKRILKKIISPFIFLVVIISLVISFYLGAYTYYYKMFPFNPSKNVKQIKKTIKTNYNILTLKSYNSPKYSKYGAIDYYDNKLIYVQGNGDFYFFNRKENQFDFEKIISEKIPNNRKAFIQRYKEKYGNTRMSNFFGVRDILIEDNVIYLSSSYYEIENDCHGLALYKTNIDNKGKILIKKWKEIFRSKQCLKEKIHSKKRMPLASSGGRIVKLDKNNLLLSVGDYAVDGYYAKEKFAQDLSNDYGKILRINLQTQKYEIYSHGHRNVQGLFVDNKNDIFATEHGPYGGDELNKIYKNKNYGWPLATFGTGYFDYTDNYKSDKSTDTLSKWPNDITSNSHDGFEKPIYSWGPYHGVSNLILYKSGVIDPRWKNNIFVSSLRAQTLTRMIYNKKKESIIYTEVIDINKRIRDIIESPQGEIVLLTDQRGGADGYNDIPEIIFISKNEDVKLLQITN